MRNVFFMILFLFVILGLNIGCQNCSPTERIYGSSVKVFTNNRILGSGVIFKVNRLGPIEEIYILTARHVISDQTLSPIINRTQEMFVLQQMLEDSNIDMTFDKATQTLYKTKRTIFPFTDVSFIRKPVGIVQFEIKMASIIYVFPDRDLAILKIFAKSGTASHFCPLMAYNGEKRIGEDLYTCGFPTPQPVLVKGVYGREMYRNGVFAGNISFGNSGGGVFNKKGEIIGILTNVEGRNEPIWHIGIFEYVDKEMIEKVLEKIK